MKFNPHIQAPSDEGAYVGQPQGLSLRVDIEFNLIAPESSLFLLVCSDSRTGNQNQSEKNYKKVLTYKIKRDIVIPYLTDRKYIKTLRRYENEQT